MLNDHPSIHFSIEFISSENLAPQNFMFRKVEQALEPEAIHLL
jgi:hypothetical protein